MIKPKYNKPIVNILLNSSWEVKAFPLKSEMRQEHPLSPLLFHIVLEILARQSEREGKKRETNRKIRSQITVFADGMIPYLEDPNHSTRRLFVLTNPAK
jgi:hypothetical protein